MVTLAGTPAGGTFTGTGVSGNTFNPATGVGTYTINYSYTNANGCVSAASTTIAVNAVPTVSAGTYAAVCTTDGLVALNGTPAGGTFSGTGWQAVHSIRPQVPEHTPLRMFIIMGVAATPTSTTIEYKLVEAVVQLHRILRVQSQPTHLSVVLQQGIQLRLQLLQLPLLTIGQFPMDMHYRRTRNNINYISVWMDQRLHPDQFVSEHQCMRQQCLLARLWMHNQLPVGAITGNLTGACAGNNTNLFWSCS